MDNLGYNLQGMFEEYKALRSEIEHRGQFQNSLFQIHVTALTAIIGAIFLSSNFKFDLLLLIPIESSLFGIWYFHHGFVILDMGTYIRQNIEHEFHKMCCPNIMKWEQYNREKREEDPIRRELTFTTLITLTYGLPGAIALLLYSYIKLFSDLLFIYVFIFAFGTFLFGIFFYVAHCYFNRCKELTGRCSKDGDDYKKIEIVKNARCINCHPKYMLCNENSNDKNK